MQVGDKSLSEGSNTDFHKNAKRLEQRKFVRIISIVGRIILQKQCINKVQKKTKLKSLEYIICSRTKNRKLISQGKGQEFSLKKNRIKVSTALPGVSQDVTPRLDMIYF